MNKDLEREYNQLKGLRSMQGKSHEYILERAEARLRKKNIDISIFTDKVEAERANSLLERYMADYTIETVSDKNTLQELIYLEVIQTRLQNKMNEFYDGETKAVPANLLTSLHQNSEAILKLKNSLGLNRGKDGKSSYDVLQHLIKRAEKWRDENQGSRTLKCPKCQQFVLLKIRTDAWEAQGHPFYKDTMLYNKALFEKYYGKTVVINDEFISEVLEVSKDFPAWVKQKTRPPEEAESVVIESVGVEKA